MGSTYSIAPNARVRASPYYDATLAAGVQSFTVYNGMLMPTDYGDLEGEYWRLIHGVSMWDVAAQRQVQLRGPDAARLVQILSPRNLQQFRTGQGKYVPLCNHDGVLINDPVILKLDAENFLISLSDSNILFWARAICAERGLRVDIREPDISPLAIQGPKSENVMASVLGDWVRKIRYFDFEATQIEHIPILISRSGYSKQGGFELYLLDGAQGTNLWNIIAEAGTTWDIAPGAPHQAERVESGLLSFGADSDDTTNPLELRLERFVDLDLPDEVIGIQSLRHIKSEGIKRHQLGVIFDASPPLERNRRWLQVRWQGSEIGAVTTVVWSWRFERNIGLALVDRQVQAAERVEVQLQTETLSAKLVALPF